MSIDSHNIIADALQGTLEAHPSWKLNQQVYEFMLQDLPAYYSLAGDDLPDNVQFVVNAGTGGGEIIVSAISIEFICDELTAFLDTFICKAWRHAWSLRGGIATHQSSAQG